jgi:hypothetical protein
MGKIIPFPAVDPDMDDRFGLCPKCHRTDGFMNAHRKEHWFVCHRHKLKWCVGWNLFSSYLYMDDSELLRQEYALQSYTPVEPWYSQKPAVAGPLTDAQNKSADDDGPF